MTNRSLVAALALSLPLMTAACAPLAAEEGYVYRVAPPPSNPHDYFRRVIKVPCPDATSPQARAEAPPVG